MNFNDVVTRVPLFYGDFMIPSAEVKTYSEINDDSKVPDCIVFIDYLLTAHYEISIDATLHNN